MDPLKKLLESNLLSPETAEVIKTEVTAVMEAKDKAHADALAEAVEATRKETIEEVSNAITESATEILGDYADIVAEAQEQEVVYEAKLQQFKDDYDKQIPEKIQEAVDAGIKDQFAAFQADLAEYKKCAITTKLAESYSDAASVLFGSTGDSEIEKLREQAEELAKLKIDIKISELTECFAPGSQQKNVAVAILEGCKSPEAAEEKFAMIQNAITRLDESAPAEGKDEKLDESAGADKGETLEEGKEEKGEIVLENADPANPDESKNTAASLRISRSLSNLNRF